MFVPSSRRNGWLALALGCLAGVTLASAASADAAVTLEPVGNFTEPTGIIFTPDYDDRFRLFVVEQRGTIAVVKNGQTLPTPFLDIRSRVATGGERGLLSMAFDPDYPTVPYFYVFYTSVADPSRSLALGDLVISAFKPSANPDVADPASERTILTIPHSVNSNHNGGQLQFGPDGQLYIATGDGGGGGDPDGNGQNLTTLLGKLLRIEPTPQLTSPYSIPQGNPFAAVAGARPEIWSYGLRNPWRFSFDRLTGALVIADVGQSAREEIDFEPASAGGGFGDNFGWNCREGLIAYSGAPLSCLSGGGFTDPVFDYPHSSGDPNAAQGCSITGGYVYRGSVAELDGRYVYADFCRSVLRSISLVPPAGSGDRSDGVNVGNPTSFGEDADGEIYVASAANGAVSRLASNLPPVQRTLTVSVAGPGSGTVSGPGIACPGDCTESYPHGTVVALQASPSAGSAFGGWAGSCAGAGGCAPRLTQNRSVSAAFGFATGPPLQTRLRLRAARYAVARGARAPLTVTVTPCPGRAGDTVLLYRGGRIAARRELDAGCTAAFAPRVFADRGFLVAIAPDSTHLSGRSNRVVIRIRTAGVGRVRGL